MKAVARALALCAMAAAASASHLTLSLHADMASCEAGLAAQDVFPLTVDGTCEAMPGDPDARFFVATCTAESITLLKADCNDDCTACKDEGAQADLVIGACVESFGAVVRLEGECDHAPKESSATALHSAALLLGLLAA